MATLRTPAHSVLPPVLSRAPSSANPAVEPDGRHQDGADPRGQELLDLYLAIAIVVPILLFVKSLWN